VEHVEAAATREPQIEQNGRRLANLDRPQRLTGTGRAGHPDPVRRQILGQKAAGRLVVLNNQDQALLVYTARRTAGENLAPSSPAQAPDIRSGSCQDSARD
jgi:hypothetical protein